MKAWFSPHLASILSWSYYLVTFLHMTLTCIWLFTILPGPSSHNHPWSFRPQFFCGPYLSTLLPMVHIWSKFFTWSFWSQSSTWSLHVFGRSYPHGFVGHNSPMVLLATIIHLVYLVTIHPWSLWPHFFNGLFDHTSSMVLLATLLPWSLWPHFFHGPYLVCYPHGLFGHNFQDGPNLVAILPMVLISDHNSQHGLFSYNSILHIVFIWSQFTHGSFWPQFSHGPYLVTVIHIVFIWSQFSTWSLSGHNFQHGPNLAQFSQWPYLVTVVTLRFSGQSYPHLVTILNMVLKVSWHSSLHSLLGHNSPHGSYFATILPGLKSPVSHGWNRIVPFSRHNSHMVFLATIYMVFSCPDSLHISLPVCTSQNCPNGYIFYNFSLISPLKVAFLYMISL